MSSEPTEMLFIVRKKGTNLEKEVMQGTLPGLRIEEEDNA